MFTYLKSTIELANFSFKDKAKITHFRYAKMEAKLNLYNNVQFRPTKIHTTKSIKIKRNTFKCFILLN